MKDIKYYKELAEKCSGSLVAHALRELEVLGWLKDGEIQLEMVKNWLEVLEVVDNQGHSGSSMNYFNSKLLDLLKSKPLSVLKDIDEEWKEIGENEFQHKRCYSVFKKGKTIYHLHGFVFSYNKYESPYTGRFSSRVFTLPNYPPEAVMIKVNEAGEVLDKEHRELMEKECYYPFNGNINEQ